MLRHFPRSLASVLLLLAAALPLRAQPAPEERKDAEAPKLPTLYQSITVTATPVEPQFDRRNAEVFRQTLFSRDDHVFQLLAAGIDAGQHEGGGKSIEVRRFGFNLDHGGGNGGLKVLVDNVQQNQSTQGHGQGYLGALKTLSPELVEEVQLINGPFSAEHGDFSSLGVVHIHLREELPEQWTLRLQGGSFASRRVFAAYSPDLKNGGAFLAVESAYTDGPFLSPLGYRRDNVTGNWMRRLSPRRQAGLKFNGGRNRFRSSGQLPLDEIAAGRLDPFGSIDGTDGGAGWAGVVSGYLREQSAGGGAWKLDGSLNRSLLDLFSNFTFYRDNPVEGDAFQQHDSRLQEAANVQYARPLRSTASPVLLTAGANLLASQINVGLYPRLGRNPTGVATRAQARIVNAAGYTQAGSSLFRDRLQLGAGLRYDIFHVSVDDRVNPAPTAGQSAGLLQPKFNLSYTAVRRLSFVLYANYGRAIASGDARGVVRAPAGTQAAATDFYQLGASQHSRRFSATADLFLIDRSHELVYNADDGSIEFQGPSRAYGFESKTSLELTRRLTLYGGLTKVFNAFYRGSRPRQYVDRAPHFVANAGLTLSAWKGWSGSFRVRATNHYRLDPVDPAVVAAGHTIFDLGASRRLCRNLDFSLSLDNLADRLYYETQNYFESRLPGQPPRFRTHATPGYPLTATAGLTFRFRAK